MRDHEVPGLVDESPENGFYSEPSSGLGSIESGLAISEIVIL
jgi:hypothetical protein